jgi:hypothetical protein
MRSFAILLVALSSCAGAQEVVNLGSVSMIQLIANPERFAGRRIAVSGYLAEGQRLYLTREHAELSDMSSAIDLSGEFLDDYRSSPCSKSLVTVSGRFVETKPPKTYMIRDIEQIVIANRATPCFSKPNAGAH